MSFTGQFQEQVAQVEMGTPMEIIPALWSFD